MLCEEAAEIFEAVISRNLGGSRTPWFSRSDTADGLRSSFLHAVSLVVSRAFSGDYGRVGEEESEGYVLSPTVILPVVDLLNGLPEARGVSLGCNAEVFTGRPFGGAELRGETQTDGIQTRVAISLQKLSRPCSLRQV